MTESESPENTDPVPATDATEVPESDGGPAAERSVSRRSGAPAWIAVLLALAALGLSARPWWPEGWRADPDGGTGALVDRLESMGERVESVDGRIASLGERVQRFGDEHEAAIGGLREELGALSERVDTSDRAGASVGEQLDELAVRLDRVQGETNSSVAGLRGRMDELEDMVGERLERFDLRLSRIGGEMASADEDLATRLRLIEIESLLSTGRNRLVAFGDVDAARAAWSRASAALEMLDGARFAPLREAVSSELDRLRGFRSPSSPARVERLHEIAGNVDSWPGVNRSGSGTASTADTAGGWRERLGSVFSRLVRVENIADESPSAAMVERLRGEIRTGLQTAALMVARRELGLAATLLDESIDRIETAFDGSSPEIRTDLEWLKGLRLDEAGAQPPALDASRRALAELMEARQ